MSDESQGLLRAKKLIAAYLDNSQERAVGCQEMVALMNGAMLVVLLSIAESLEEISTFMPTRYDNK